LEKSRLRPARPGAFSDIGFVYGGKKRGLIYLRKAACHCA
jgi:hypothetical protein